MTPGTRPTSTFHLLLFLAGLGGLFLALLGILFFSGLAVLAAVNGDIEAAWLSLWTDSGLVVLAAALAPGLYWSGRVALGGSYPRPGRPLGMWVSLAVLYPICLAAGGLTFADSGGSMAIGIVALVGTAVVPVLAITWIVRRRGPAIAPTRAWGHFTIGLTGMPLAALVVEFIAILPLALVAGLWMLGSPEAEAIFSMMDPAAVPDPQALTDVATRMLSSPAAIAAVYGYLALVIPIVEEVIKTMAVWPFLRRGLSPSQAFLGGALGGAGYALFEALFLSQPGEAWLGTTVARSGATFLHVFTAALTSWGLMEVVRRRRYGAGLASFAASVAMHAAWNAAAVTIGIESIPLDGDAASPLAGLAAVAPAALAGLVLVSLIGLTMMWRRLPAPLDGAPVEADTSSGRT